MVIETEQLIETTDSSFEEDVSSSDEDFEAADFDDLVDGLESSLDE